MVECWLDGLVVRRVGATHSGRAHHHHIVAGRRRALGGVRRVLMRHVTGQLVDAGGSGVRRVGQWQRRSHCGGHDGTETETASCVGSL